MTTETNEDTGSDFAAFEAKVTASEPAPAEEAPKDDVAPAAEAEEAQPAADAGEEDNSSEGDDDSSEEKPAEKTKPKASDRIRELNGKLRASERENTDLIARLEAIENRLPDKKVDDTPTATDKTPDPSDHVKYPLGALDDRYIEDMIEHVASAKVAEHLESVRQREAETALQAETERQNAEVLEKANTVIASGSELFDDFEESVVVPALQGKFDLTQITFEAIAEVENGARILHALASDTKEAARVAKLSPLQQLKYVSDKDAEFAGGSKPEPRKLPGAPIPPSANIKGSSGRSSFNPETASFADFERHAMAKQR